ncbi:hypothetical protein MG296_10705 [Flavobacteriaceae bacterium TK19130]|nr:hypothetical protein [Thermobacterium salinum]
MAEMTANTVFPIFLALPLEQQQEFLRKASGHLSKKDMPNDKKQTVIDKVASKLGDHFRPENEEMLVSMIMTET